MEILISTSFIIIYLIAALGWGRLAASIIYNQSTGSVAYDVSLGMAIWIFLGGIMNAFQWVNSLSLNAILGAGLLFSSILLGQNILSRRKKRQIFSQLLESVVSKEILLQKILNTLPVLIILAVSIYLAIYLLPASAFNYHDDYYKYLPRLFRLLHTGKVGGTPFDFVGIDSFGAFTLLQVFFVEHLSFKFVNGFDAVLCFLLSGLLINDLGRKLCLNFVYRSGAIIIFLVIQPQYVNISALYSGSLIILALIYSYLLFLSDQNSESIRKRLLAAIPISLFIASLLLLKITFVPFAATFFLTFFVLLLFLNNEREKVLIVSVFSAILVVIIIFPWITVAIENMLELINIFLTKISQNAGIEEQAAAGASLIERFFVVKELKYGGNVIEFTFMYVLVLTAALAALFILITDNTSKRKDLLIVTASAGISFVVGLLFNIKYSHGDPYVGLRYTCPLLIAVLPAVILTMSRYLGAGYDERRDKFGRIDLIRIFCMFTILIMVIILAPNRLEKFMDVSRQRTMLSFPITEIYIKYNERALSENRHDRVRSVQEKTEPGTIIMTWFDTPFHLDFARNKIFTVASAININPDVTIEENFTGGGEWLRDYLKDFGVRYVFWGYRGNPKSKSKYNKEFDEALLAMSRNSKMIYDTGSKVFFDIGL